MPSAGTERYVFEKLIDKGGMGEVYRVHDRDLKRPVAMKIVHEALSEEYQGARFVEEAQITGQLDHPNIVPVYELGVTDGGRAYFTMKEVRGRSLADVLDALDADDAATRAEFTLTRILQLMQKVCEAMAFAHARGVIHRDLKPANIMVGPFGEVLVMDWGLALPMNRLDDASSRQQILRREDVSANIELIRKDAESSSQISRSTDARLTIDGAIVGTPEYMPPEQAAGDREQLSPASDVYAIGACLYEMLTLYPPFTDEDPYKVVDQVLRSAVIPPSKRARDNGQPRVPAAVEAIVLKCLEKERKDRYHDAGGLSAEIQRYLEGEPVGAHAESLGHRLLRWARKHPILTTSLVTGLMALVGFGSVWQVKSARLARKKTEDRMHSLRVEAKAMRQRNRALEEKEQTQRRLAQAQRAQQQQAERRSRAIEPYDLGLEFVRRRVRWDLALEQFNLAIELDPEFAAAYLQRGETLLRLGRVDQALANYQQVQRLLARTGRWQLARTYLQMGNIYRDTLHAGERAAKMYREAVRADPGSMFARIAHISLLSLEFRYSAALVALRGLGDEADYYWEVHLLRGQVRGRLARADGSRNPVYEPRQALISLDRLIQLRPGYYLAYAHRSKVHELMRQPSKALHDIDQAITLNPRVAAQFGYRGYLRGQTRKYPGALEDFGAAIKLDPANPQWWINRGLIQFYLRRYPEARADYDEALSLQPDSTRALIFRGVVNAQLKRPKAAEADYGAAIKSQPRGWSAYSHRALLYRGTRRYAESAQDFRTALTRCPKGSRAKIYYNRGQLWIDVKLFDKAINDFRQADKLGIAESVIRRGQVLVLVGCFRQAEKLADTGMARFSAARAKSLLLTRNRWRAMAERWEARVRENPGAFDVRAGQAQAAAFTQPLATGLAMFEKLLPELLAHGARAAGPIVWGLDAGDLLGTYARLWNEAGNSRNAIKYNQLSIQAERGKDVVSRFQRGQRWAIIASHHVRLADRSSGAAQAGLDREAVAAIRNVLRERRLTLAAFEKKQEFAGLVGRPTYRAAFGK